MILSHLRISNVLRKHFSVNANAPVHSSSRNDLCYSAKQSKLFSGTQLQLGNSNAKTEEAVRSPGKPSSQIEFISGRSTSMTGEYMEESPRNYKMT